MSPDKRRAKAALMVVGALAIALGLSGAWYNAGNMLRFPRFLDYLRLRAFAVPPGFTPVFWAMSSASLAIDVVVVACGIQYVRMRNVNRVFVVVATFEVLYVVVEALAGPGLPRIGPAIYAAAGIANGGLVPQAIVLFPVWAPFVAIWAGRRLRAPDAARAA